MTFVEPPSLKPRDDLDGLLRAFFRAQMPLSWPPPRQPTASRRGLLRGRWALAASVALLLLSSVLLPSRFTPNAQPQDGIAAPTVASDDIHRKMEREHKKRQQENTNKPDLSVEDGEPLPEMDDADLPFMK